MEYWEMDIWKVNKFNFLNEEVEKFVSRWNQNLVNMKSPSSLKQKTFEYCSWDKQIIYSVFHLDMVMCQTVLVKYIYG